MTRLDKYCTLLKHIYGKRIVDLFTVKDGNTLMLTMRDELNNQLAKKDYQRKKNEGCVICKSIFKNPSFSNRILEFPGWIGSLNFIGTTPAKEIMIIGEAPTTLKDQINIAFGLGLFPIESDGMLNAAQIKKIYSKEKTLLKSILKNQVQRNRLWEYLNLLFLKKLDVIKPKIYITDLCKCNDDVVKDGKKVKNQGMWAECLSKRLIEEIKLINPKLIIFQGGSSYDFVLGYLKSQGIIKSKQSILEKTESYYPKFGEPDFYEEAYGKPRFGKFHFNGKDIYFFKIYHQAAFNRYLKISDRNNYIKQNHQFIKKRILKEVLNIN